MVAYILIIGCTSLWQVCKYMCSSYHYIHILVLIVAIIGGAKGSSLHPISTYSHVIIVLIGVPIVLM